MTLTASVVFALPPALVSQLTLRRNLAGVAISSGPLAESDPEEWIQVSRPRSLRTPRTLTGKMLGGHDEDGTLTVLVMVSRNGAGQACIDEVRERCDALCAEVEAGIHTDPTLGGLLSWAYVSAISEADQGIQPAPNAGHWMTAELTVSYRARIYPGEVA